MTHSRLVLGIAALSGSMLDGLLSGAIHARNAGEQFGQMAQSLTAAAKRPPELRPRYSTGHAIPISMLDWDSGMTWQELKAAKNHRRNLRRMNRKTRWALVGKL